MDVLNDNDLSTGTAAKLSQNFRVAGNLSPERGDIPGGQEVLADASGAR
jgi:hypothetical protein